MQQQIVSKSQLKSQLLEYLRKLEKDKVPLIVTHEGKPVAKIIAYREDDEEILKRLRGSVTYYGDITEPLDVEWEALK